MIFLEREVPLVLCIGQGKGRTIAGKPFFKIAQFVLVHIFPYTPAAYDGLILLYPLT
jgi:hypothetical protein